MIKAELPPNVPIKIAYIVPHAAASPGPPKPRPPLELILTFGIAATLIIIGLSIGATCLRRKVFKRIPAFESDTQSKPKSEIFNSPTPNTQA